MKLRENDMFGPKSDAFDPLKPGSGMDREVVVWLDEHADLVALLHASSVDYPRLLPLSGVLATIDMANTIVEDSSRLRPKWTERELDDNDRVIRDRRMAVLKPLVENKPAIFDAVERGRLIGARARETKHSVNSVKKWLLAFFVNGRCGNALLPRLDLCSGSGPREPVEGAAKRGRKPLQGPGNENVTGLVKAEFQTAVVRELALTGEAFTVRGAHRRWLTEFCYETIEVDGLPEVRRKRKYDEIEPASYLQFYDWYRESGQAKNVSIKVLSEPVFEKDNRAITSTSTNETRGPGSRFQIDASVVNFALASSLNRFVCVGRPYIYFVRDVWERYIMGYYLGFQPPSMVTAALALMNAFSSKEELLRDFGFDPETNPWSGFLCQALLHDGGELTGHWGDWLVNSLNIDFEQTASDRGDLKGAVETLFHWSDVEWSRVMPGRRVSSKYRGRGRTKEDVELAREGKLRTTREFETELIRFILRFNNQHVLSKYDADADMVAAGIDRVPHDMLQWGIVNRGSPRTLPDEVVRFRLMPRADVRIHPEGILWQGFYFSCPEMAPLQAEAARTNRAIPATISHDLTCNSVLWHRLDAPGGYIECERADSCRWIEGLRLEEAVVENDERAAREAGRKRQEELAEAQRASEAKTPVPTLPSDVSKRPSTKAEAKTAKAAARAQARKGEEARAFAPVPASPVPAPSAQILTFPRPGARTYASPSLEEVEDV